MSGCLNHFNCPLELLETKRLGDYVNMCYFLVEVQLVIEMDLVLDMLANTDSS